MIHTIRVLRGNTRTTIRFQTTCHGCGRDITVNSSLIFLCRDCRGRAICRLKDPAFSKWLDRMHKKIKEAKNEKPKTQHLSFKRETV